MRSSLIALYSDGRGFIERLTRLLLIIFTKDAKNFLSSVVSSLHTSSDCEEDGGSRANLNLKLKRLLKLPLCHKSQSDTNLKSHDNAGNAPVLRLYLLLQLD